MLLTKKDLIEKSIPEKEKVEYICWNCGKKAINKILTIQNRYLKYNRILCQHCSTVLSVLKKFGSYENYLKYRQEKQRQKCIEKYGVENIFQTKQCKEKIKNHWRNIFGVDSYTQTDSFKKKSKQTYLKKYGVEYGSQSKEIKNKVKQTCLNHYGVEYALQSKEVKEKSQKTKKEKYGNPFFTNPKKRSETKFKKYGNSTFNNLKKTKQTCLKKYGKTSFSKTNKFKRILKKHFKNKTKFEKFLTQQKSILTCRKHYGVDYYFQTQECSEHRKSTYLIGDLKFDSSWEVYFYLYFKLKNVNIKRISQNSQLFYYIFNNKKHFCSPDFEIDGEYYEIKGPQFLKENGKWQNPYNHLMDEEYEARHQCLLKNKVSIIYDISKFKEFVLNQNINVNIYKLKRKKDE